MQRLSRAALPREARPAVLRMEAVGANPHATATGLEPLPGKVNYFIGNDRAKWRTNVPTFAKVCYRDVYPGVDLTYYGNRRQLEYDFTVAPGANPHSIRLRIEGARRVRIDHDGRLLVGTEAGTVCWHQPVIYQRCGRGRRRISGRYVTDGQQRIGFQVAAYDPHQPLVIDPVLSFSTFLGGQKMELSQGVAADGMGNAYVTGFSYSTDFPTANALEPSFHGTSREDGFVAKIDTIHSVLLYSTYFGGESTDWGLGISIDSAGSAYVTGLTQSTDFPTVRAIDPLYNRDGTAGVGKSDGFVLKLNPTGSALLYSTYLGGSMDDQGTAIAVDAGGNAYVTGWTNSYDFPTVAAIRDYYVGGNPTSSGDAFVCKLNAGGSALLYSTYLGGGGADAAYGIAVDASGSAYVAGSTGSRDFPTVHPLQRAYGGGVSDGFVTKIDPSGSALAYSTYLGGSGRDQINGIAVDAAGNAYVAGSTYSPNFPVANALQPRIGGKPDPQNGYAADAFVARLSPTGSALTFSTYLGGSSQDAASSIALDAAGNIYVAGGTESPDFPVVDALQPSISGPPMPKFGFASDVFVSKLNNLGSRLIYSTYLGGNDSDTASGIAVDGASNAYLTGTARSADFPLVRPLQSELGGGGAGAGNSDAFIVKISDTMPPSPPDTLPPATVAAATPVPNDRGWNNTPVTVDLTARDEGGSDVQEIRYALIGAQTGSGIISGSHASIRVANEGVSVLIYSAIDHAGNQESAHTLLIRIDTTPPRGTVTTMPDRNAFLWNNSPVTIQVHASDGPRGSGVKEIRYTVYGAESETGVAAGDTLSINISADGVTTLSASVVDNSGNQELPVGTTVWIDQAPPTTMATANPPPDASGWNGTPVTVSLHAADVGEQYQKGSRVKEIHYVLTGAQEGSAVVTNDHATVDVTADGITTLTYFAVDFAGNQERPKSLTIRIDKAAIAGDTEPPVTTAVATPPPDADGWNRNYGGVKVTLDAVDPGGSGVYQLHYSWSGAQTGGDVINGSHVEFYVGTLGVTTITYYAVDNALNQEPPRVLIIRIASSVPN